MKLLITGTAGFIGFHLAKHLLEKGYTVIGLDNVNDYYDVNLKYARLEETGIPANSIEYGKIVTSKKFPQYRFIKLNLEDQENIFKLFKEEHFEKIIHLAAQAGVRYSLTNPHTYMQSNITGFLNILEAARYYPVKHLVYASSSSVYGLNEEMPFSVKHNVDHPVSLYAASKKSNELMAHTYSYLFHIPVTSLRFFTVYGPWGRPDMALFIFTKSILEDKPIDVFNFGEMERDFTYIDDITESVSRIVNLPPCDNSGWKGKKPDPSCSVAPYRLYNIGNSKPVKLLDFIKAIETSIGTKAKMNFIPMQPGDIPKTWADADSLYLKIDYRPLISVKEGVKRFVDWYRAYYQL